MRRTDLRGQVVAITGGANGIGLATANACARAGMRVAIGDLDGERAHAVAADLGPAAIGLVLDVADPGAVDGFLDEAEARLGPLDVLINNAGVFVAGHYRDEDPATTDHVIDVNVRGVMSGSRAALRRFATRGHGHLVNLASSGGLVAVPYGATYCASKHAVVGFTRALRHELRGTGIRTTVVCPGQVDTAMTADFARLPGFRVLQPDVVADAIVAALRSGRQEVIVPPELGVVTRVLTLLPPTAADAVKRAAGLHRLRPDLN